MTPGANYRERDENRESGLELVIRRLDFKYLHAGEDEPEEHEQRVRKNDESRFPLLGVRVQYDDLSEEADQREPDLRRVYRHCILFEQR